jgi:hypothetical protein
MLAMTEEEARSIMKTHGWSYKERKPRRKAKYVYAQRWKGKGPIERYICPLTELGNFTEPQLVEILERPIEEPSSANCEPEVLDTTSPLTNTDEP